MMYYSSTRTWHKDPFLHLGQLVHKAQRTERRARNNLKQIKQLATRRSQSWATDA
jgi:hypothetical protein